MNNYVEGVWSDLRLNTAEEKAIAGAARVHAILVEPVIRELHRLGDMGIFSLVETSADFMDFRHYDAKRFESTMRHVDIGFVGWPGSADDPLVSAIRRVAFELGKLVVVTRGAECIMAFDGPAGREFSVPVTAVPVLGTTVGCGDAFIAAFLAARIHGTGILAAIAAAKPAGAAATAWMRPLPDAAYGISAHRNKA
jgi:sugar/nucleoside kinase (ribokinase family)